MRNDETKTSKFANSQQWNDAESRFLLYELVEKSPGEMGYRINSFSGNERNRLFFQSKENFVEASTVSGADFREDGRGFVLFDFDRDGWLDMGVTSTQHPRLRILRNMMGENGTDRSVFIRLVGGHRGIDSQTDWSSRDPYGAEMVVTVGEIKRAYRLSAGEGLSSQNSNWVHVGMNQAQTIDRIEIIWPSGKTTKCENVGAGERVLIFENAAEDSPTAPVSK